MTNKTFPQIKKLIIYYSIVLLLFSAVFAVSNIASGQELTTTPSPTPTVTEQKETTTDAELKALKEAAEKKMGEYPELVKEGYKPFEVGNLRIVDNWASLNLLSYPENPPKDAHVIVPDLYLALAEKAKDSNWNIYIENEPEYSDKLQMTPDSLVSPRVKNGLLSKYEADQNNGMQLLLLTRTEDEYHTPGLPYAAGESWRYTQGPHNGYGTDTALDFATPSGSSATVRAAEDGVVVASTQTCLRVRRYNSDLEFLYQHINSSDISNWSINEEIDLGNAIGSTTTNSGCGGSSTGHHVHFEILGPGLEGESLNGWTVDGDNLVKDGTTKSPNGTDTVSHGDWIIEKGSDYVVKFPGEAQIPRNVIVEDDSVLEIGSNARLDIDFVNYKLEVENSSGVTVKNGGGI